MELANRVRVLQPSPTTAMDARAKALVREGVDVISFSVGEPDFDTPEHVRQAAVEAIRAGHTRYTAVAGIPELREAVSAKLWRDNGLDYPPSQILVSSGAKESCYQAIMALVDRGDEVVIPAPYWVTYPEQVRIAGGVPVILPALSGDFKVTAEQLREVVTPRTRLFILNSPANPTGAVYTRQELAALAEVCVERNVAILADEIYEKLLYEGEHVSIASLAPEVKRLTVTVNGVSKAYAMTGWRIGYAAAEPEVVAAMQALQSHATTHPASIAQYAAVAALNGPQEPVAAMVEAFRRRREAMVERLRRLPGFRVGRPAGAFYVFPDVRELLGRRIGGTVVRDDVQLAELFLEAARVAVVPGSGFGAPGFLRFSYATSLERIEEGMDRLAALLATVS
ncbi:MAG: pyridoxal phosphate-dependent aminotransferase [Clostridia bacterium]|nr:pyridoxal phosphate-dependent aminotransferase [Clostridia bacterium]